MSLTYGTEGSLRVGQQAPDFTATVVVDLAILRILNFPTIAVSMLSCFSIP